MSTMETMFALGLEALLLATLLTFLAASISLGREARLTTDAIVKKRHLEHLIDRAIVPAGGGPQPRPALAIATTRLLVLTSDLDGDGSIDDRSAERITFEIRPEGSQTLRLVQRIGRQASTLDGELPGGNRFRYHDAAMRPAASITAVRSIEIPIFGGSVTVALRTPPS